MADAQLQVLVTGASSGALGLLPAGAPDDAKRRVLGL
jgi:hypothetical protein